MKDRTTMGHAAVLVRGPASVFAGDRRPVLERGHDPQLGALVARTQRDSTCVLLQLNEKKLLRGMRLSYKKPRQVLDRAPQP